MNIRDLRYFLAVAELEHFGHAADRCCVSQPTLSGQIKKLEEELGVKLFERTNRRVILTECGQHIANSAKYILREVDTIHEVSKSFNNPLTGKFRLGAFPTLATYIFPDLVTKVKKDMPDLRIILIEEKTAELLKKLRNGKIDAALLALPVHDDFLASVELFDDEFYLAVQPEHPLAKHSKIDKKTLNKQSLLLLEEGHCLREQALEVCRINGMSEEQDFKATGLETLRQMVKAGTGITLFPDIARYEGEKGIHYIPFQEPVPTRTIGLVFRKTTARKKVIDNIAKNLIL